MKYLIDTSALVRILRHQVDEVWYGHGPQPGGERSHRLTS
jgi:hypothetical protein